MQRSGSGWFETLLNSHPNISSNGEVFSLKQRRQSMETIQRTLDTIYNLEWISSAAKHDCVAAVGFKWMLNQVWWFSDYLSSYLLPCDKCEKGYCSLLVCFLMGQIWGFPFKYFLNELVDPPLFKLDHIPKLPSACVSVEQGCRAFLGHKQKGMHPVSFLLNFESTDLCTEWNLFQKRRETLKKDTIP